MSIAWWPRHTSVIKMHIGLCLRKLLSVVSFSYSPYFHLLFWGKKQFSFILYFKCSNALASFWEFKKAIALSWNSPGKWPNLSFCFLSLCKGRSMVYLTIIKMFRLGVLYIYIHLLLNRLFSY